MTDALQIYDLGRHIAAFTTDRTIGRHKKKVCEAAAYAMNQREESEGTMVGRELRVTRPHQIHGTDVVLVEKGFFRLPKDIQRMLMEGKDAVMTQSKYIVLGVSTADCIPIIIYDAEHHAAAAIHAGWRGTVKGIVAKTLSQMYSAFRTDPSNCCAVIGPGINMYSFEVGQEVYDAFAQAGMATDTTARQMPTMHPTGNADEPTMKWHIDLKEINRQQMIELGIAEEKIQVSPIDTYTDDRFFSARREETDEEKCGRIFTAFVLQ